MSGFSGFTSIVQGESENHELLQVQAEPGASSQLIRLLPSLGTAIRASINSILGYTRLILKGIDGPISDLLRQDMEAIYAAGKQALDTANETLDFTKIESGSLELNFEENVNLGEIVASLVNSIKDRSPARAIALDLELAPDLPATRADPLKIRQILIQLLSLTQNPAGAGRIAISVTQQSQSGDGNEAEILVCITGKFPLPKIAEPPFIPPHLSNDKGEAEVARQEVSLSIIKHVIEMHAGRLGMQDQAGMSRIFFTLPISRPQTRRIKTLAVPISRVNAHRIIHIDDDRANINLIQQIFSRDPNLLIIPSLIAERAVEEIRRVNPCAIILNPHMRALDLQHVLKSLNQDPELRRIPTFLLESNFLDQTHYHAIHESAIVLHKGLINENDLREAVIKLTASHIPASCSTLV